MTTPPWKYGTQKFVVHTVNFKSIYAHKPDVQCAILLDPRMIPLLPTNLCAVEPPQPPCFQVRETGEKGAGMFALQDISAGQLIIREHPAIIIPAPSFPREYGAYETLYQALPEFIRTDLLKMANWKSPEECSHEEGIARTNGTDVDLLFPSEMNRDSSEQIQAREYGATFLKIDRCNHSCSPNAAHKWDVATFSSSLYALRDIHAGEEICITYTDITAPRQTRRAKLEKSYGFLCHCQTCDQEDEEAVERSDLIREELHDWWFTNPGYTKWWKDLCRADDAIIKSHQRALELIERESLQALQVPFIEEIALCYAVLGEKENFRVWGKKVVDLSRIANPGFATQFERWTDNPESMKQWAWRRKQQSQRTRYIKFNDGDELVDLSMMLSLSSSDNDNEFW
ncbi:hypothetical protein AMATHDRAFT_8946 [Amanita thiersii Skay4041]|uniref:SET domain-containing protein n=1 Tax=Amanita thiersii Skay4041 TaxID=703135 RepID=A0A2A9N8V4_9AGAR|nr:hypothetical protein AMATHDRAFT_8946 [Amanita thiersii Skay4041]